MTTQPNSLAASEIALRDVIAADLPIFFEHQSDPESVQMAAFTARDPADRAAFLSHWQRIFANSAVRVKTIVFNQQAVGHVLAYSDEGGREISYWIGKDHWGKGIAPRALALFLAECELGRPIYARAAKDNTRSLRVLQKCGFEILSESRGFANARGCEIDELLFVLQIVGDRSLGSPSGGVGGNGGAVDEIGGERLGDE